MTGQQPSIAMFVKPIVNKTQNASIALTSDEPTSRLKDPINSGILIGKLEPRARHVIFIVTPALHLNEAHHQSSV